MGETGIGRSDVATPRMGEGKTSVQIPKIPESRQKRHLEMSKEEETGRWVAKKVLDDFKFI